MAASRHRRNRDHVFLIVAPRLGECLHGKMAPKLAVKAVITPQNWGYLANWRAEDRDMRSVFAGAVPFRLPSAGRLRS